MFGIDKNIVQTQQNQNQNQTQIQTQASNNYDIGLNQNNNNSSMNNNVNLNNNNDSNGNIIRNAEPSNDDKNKIVNNNGNIMKANGTPLNDLNTNNNSGNKLDIGKTEEKSGGAGGGGLGLGVGSRGKELYSRGSFFALRQSRNKRAATKLKAIHENETLSNDHGHNGEALSGVGAGFAASMGLASGSGTSSDGSDSSSLSSVSQKLNPEANVFSPGQGLGAPSMLLFCYYFFFVLSFYKAQIRIGIF